MVCIRCKSCGVTPGKNWDMSWNHEQDLCPDCTPLYKKGTPNVVSTMQTNDQFQRVSSSLLSLFHHHFYCLKSPFITDSLKKKNTKRTLSEWSSEMLKGGMHKRNVSSQGTSAPCATNATRLALSSPCCSAPRAAALCTPNVKVSPVSQNNTFILNMYEML